MCAQPRCASTVRDAETLDPAPSSQPHIEADPLALDTMLAEWRSIDARLRAQPPARLTATDGTTALASTEWPLFERVYFALASCSLAERVDSANAALLRRAAARALDEALAPERTAFIRDHFGDVLTDDAATPSTLVHGNVLLAFERCGASEEFAVLSQRADRIAAAFDRAYGARSDGALPSYRALTWITDNLAALAALHLRAQRTGAAPPSYGAQWIDFVRRRSIDPRTGLVIAPFNSATNAPIGPARGCATMMSQPALAIIDPTFAREQWTRAQTHLVATIAGITGAREYATGVTGRADGDSGRIVMGFGESASGFAIAAAASMGDHDAARRLAQSAWLATGPRRARSRIDASLPIVGHAIILYGKSLIR